MVIASEEVISKLFILICKELNLPGHKKRIWYVENLIDVMADQDYNLRRYQS